MIEAVRPAPTLVAGWLLNAFVVTVWETMAPNAFLHACLAVLIYGGPGSW